MVRKLFFALLLITTIPAYAVEVTYLSGKINLTKEQTEGAADILVLPLGKLAVGKLNLFHELKGDKHLINGNAEFKSKDDKPVFLIYYVALRDKKGLLIATTNGDLQIGQTGNIHQFASALMPLPRDQIEQITNYEVVLYESDRAIGS